LAVVVCAKIQLYGFSKLKFSKVVSLPVRFMLLFSSSHLKIKEILKKVTFFSFGNSFYCII